LFFAFFPLSPVAAKIKAARLPFTITMRVSPGDR